MDTPACTRTVSPTDAPHLQPLLKEIPNGGVLCLRPGRYVGMLIPKRSITIRGLGRPEEVILDGGWVPGVISVSDSRLKVVFVRLTVTGGSGSPIGTVGAVSAHGLSDLLFEDVIFTGNRCDLPGAQVLFTDGGNVVLSRCRVVGNHGRRARAIYATELTSVTLRDTLVADNEAGLPEVSLSGSGRYLVERSTIISGSDQPALQMATREGEAAVSDSVIVGKGQAFVSATPATVRIARSVISGGASDFTDGGGNRRAPMSFATEGEERYLPAPGSPAIGIAGPSSGARDLSGHPRKDTGGAAGAFEAR